MNLLIGPCCFGHNGDMVLSLDGWIKFVSLR
jgi:hypothetical protein